MPLKFVLVLVLTGTTVSLTSLAWPKLTRQSRPPPLQQVHDLVVNTNLGQQAADTLGVTNESEVAPINIASLAGSIVNSVVSSVEQRAQQVVVQQAASQLLKQFDRLSHQEQQEIKEVICKP